MNYLAFKTYLACFLVAAGYDDLSYNKIAIQSPIYSSSNANYIAHNAIDRNTSTCMRTEQIGRHSPYKTMWWKVDLGGLYNIYSIHILFKNYDGLEKRQQGRYAGFSLYVSNTGDVAESTLCYKNERQLPPLNFTTICAEYGRYVIFYNERLDAVTYPDGYEVLNVYIELCEVQIQGCKRSGVYGSKCDMPCPTNCRNNTCHIQNGTCFSCKAGWTGMTCTTRCEVFWYGERCSQRCSGHCRDKATCNHVTGQCDGGCDAGWTGALCDTECNDLTYGYDCTNNCSGNCLHGSSCNKQTGQCDRGCNPGYTDSYCSKKCSSGYYGKNCKEHCNGYCINNKSCDHVKGVCPDGCEDGYIGIHCNKSCGEGYYGANCTQKCFSTCEKCRNTDGYCSFCKKGYHGRNCSLVCFPNCKSDTCIRTDNLCTCAAGWMGDNCMEECVQSYGENCKNLCSEECVNKTCDRMSGRCLYGCKDGKNCDPDCLQITSDDKEFSTSTIFLFLLLAMNIAFITCCIVFMWGALTRRVSFRCFNHPYWKRSQHYANTDIKTDEDTTYQELGPSIEDISATYQNTTMH